MSYCANCGRKIEDEEKGCYVCNTKSQETIFGEIEDVSWGKMGSLDSIQMDTGWDQREADWESEQSKYEQERVLSKNVNFEKPKAIQSPSLDYNTSHEDSNYDRNNYDRADVPEYGKILPIWVKVLLTLVVLFSSYGWIIGIVLGIALRKNISTDYSRFGKMLLILSVILLVIPIITMLIFGLVIG